MSKENVFTDIGKRLAIQLERLDSFEPKDCSGSATKAYEDCLAALHVATEKALRRIVNNKKESLFAEIRHEFPGWLEKIESEDILGFAYEQKTQGEEHLYWLLKIRNTKDFVNFLANNSDLSTAKKWLAYVIIQTGKGKFPWRSKDQLTWFKWLRDRFHDLERAQATSNKQ